MNQNIRLREYVALGIIAIASLAVAWWLLGQPVELIRAYVTTG